MKIVVTGGNGFIGSNLIRALCARGHDVVSIDDLSTGKEINEVRTASYLYEDIEKITYFEGSEVDVVFHLAALARIRPSFQYPTEYFRVNVKGTEAVADWAKNYQVKMIYAGSSSVHNNPFTSPYATYKALGENIVQLYRQSYNLNAHIARFYNVYGPLEILEGEYASLLGIWRSMMKKGQPLPIIGDGEQVRDFTFVDDIVDGLIKIMDYEGGENNIWELGTGFTYSVNELASLFNDKYKKGTIHLPDVPGNYRESYRMDDKAIELLGWAPKNRIPEYISSL